MSVAAALAAVAGALAGVGAVEALAAVAAWRAARPGGRGAGAVAAVLALGRRLGAPTAPDDLRVRIAAAGLPSGVGTADVMAAKAGGAVAAMMVAAVPLLTAPLRLTVTFVAVAGAAGFMAPDLWLRRRARRRATAAALELADVLDLLRVAVEAGLPTGRALAEVGRRRGGVVARELVALGERVALGVGRERALDELTRRLPLPAVATLVAAIGRADRHGAPLAPALEALALDARAERARRLRERAAAAAPRIQLVVALLLVPAAMLLVAAGLIRGLA